MKQMLSLNAVCTERRDNMDDMEPINMSLGFLKTITENFSDQRILGRGTFGVVYKVCLDTIYTCYVATPCAM
jgi:hypothetical protein